MPTRSPDPTTQPPRPQGGSWLAVGIWILLAVVNILVIVVDGAIWAAVVAVAAIAMAVLTVRQIRGRDARG